MYNLHCHTFLSDGELVASEVAVRYAAAGYKAIAITDHADYSNIKPVVAAVMEFTRHWKKGAHSITVLPGIELTHIPPTQFAELAAYARAQGIKVIVGHGESPVEPVAPGTNHAALLADIDILAHPGRITGQDVLLAKERGIFLEITSRKGHDLANAHVARLAKKFGAPVVVNTDGHAPKDIITPAQLKKVGMKAGLTKCDLALMDAILLRFIEQRCARRIS